MADDIRWHNMCSLAQGDQSQYLAREGFELAKLEKVRHLHMLRILHNCLVATSRIHIAKESAHYFPVTPTLVSISVHHLLSFLLC